MRALETSPKDWATGYVWPAAKHGEVLKLSIPSTQSFLYEGFFYNTRRPLFADPVLREALAYAFDFRWMNKNLFYDFFTRTRSYFGTDELAAKGLPSPAELKLLGSLPQRVAATPLHPGIQPTGYGRHDGGAASKPAHCLADAAEGRLHG